MDVINLLNEGAAFISQLSHYRIEVLVGVLAALAVSAAFQLLKAKLKREISPATAMTILTIMSLVVTVAETVMNFLQANPAILGANTLAILGATQIAYRFAISPVHKFTSELWGDVKTGRAARTPQAAPASTTEFAG